MYSSGFSFISSFYKWFAVTITLIIYDSIKNSHPDYNILQSDNIQQTAKRFLYYGNESDQLYIQRNNAVLWYNNNVTEMKFKNSGIRL